MDISAGMRRRKGTHSEEVGDIDQKETAMKFGFPTTNATGPKNSQEEPASDSSRLTTPVMKKTSPWQMIPFSPKLFGASIFAARIPFVRAADAGDEFTNNFVTDLAPLLALFGERVATQFMSESFTIADSIIFAVAPLGIMTAIVGAIRVGGPNELRAVIGRAKETQSTVELELMSSTSTEVCELWNGAGIVRVLGKSPIIELIYVLPANDDPDNASEQTSLNTWQDDLGIYDFDSALKLKDDKKLLRPISFSSSVSDNSSQIKYSDLAPNLSLNMGGQTVPVFELWVVAIFGIMLQLGVVVFAGLSVLISNRSSSFKKDGATPQPYAFPLMAVGTLLLVLGMFLCSHIVNRSTTEETWEFEQLNGAQVKVAWLQQGGEVNDQLFESHALFPPVLEHSNKANILSRFIRWIIDIIIITIKWCGYFTHFLGIKISRHYLLGAIVLKVYYTVQKRQIKKWYLNNCQFFKNTLSTLKPSLRSFHSRSEYIIVLGIPFEFLKDMFESLKDQFKPLRYPSSFFLKKKRRFPNLKDFISDMRDITIERKPSIRRSRKPSDLKDQSSFVILAIGTSLFGFFGQFLGLRLLHWSVTVSQLVITVIMTVLRAWVRRNLIHKPTHKRLEAGYELDWMAGKVVGCKQWNVVTWDVDRPPLSNSSLATNTFIARRRLGTLSRWPSQWVKAVDSTTKALEAVMNFLFSSEEVVLDKGYWSTRGSFEWEILVEVVDNSKEIHLEEITLNMRRVRLLDGPWGPWRASKSEIEAVLGLWMLYFKDIELQRGTTIPSQGANSSPRNGEENDPERGRFLRTFGQCDTTGRINYERWIRRGSDFVKVDDTYLSNFSGKLGQYDHVIGIPRWSTDSSIKSPLLGIVSDTKLESICGQTILAGFISGMAAHINIEAKVSPREGNKGEKRAFGMSTTVLAGLAKEIELTGLANTEEAYMSIVPMLSKFGKLPRFDDTEFFTTFAETAKSHLENGEFEQAEWVLLWLFHCAETTANTFEENNEWMKAGQIYIDLRRACTIISESNDYINKVDDRIALFCESTFSAICDRAKCDKIDAELPHTIGLLVECMTNVLGKTSEKTLSIWKDKNLHKLSNDSVIRSADERLLEAAKNGRALLVQELLDEKANIESLDFSLRTPLILASMSGHTSVVSVLIRNNAQTAAQDYRGQTSLHHASARGHTQVVQTLLLRHGPIDIPDNGRKTALDMAVKNNAGGIVNLLLFYGAQDIDGNARKLSREASIKGSGYRIKLMYPDKLEEEALYWAVWKGSREAVEFLSTNGFGLNWKDEFMRNPLHIAASNGSIDVVRKFLDLNADIGAKDKNENTVLHMASVNGQVDTVKLLLDQGVYKEAKDNDSETALHQAAENGHTETVKLLLDRGVDKEALGNIGSTALHLAAGNGHTETVKLLLDRGVDKEAKDIIGKTAFHLAALNGHTETVKLLLDRGIDKDGQTELHLAAWSGHTETMKPLMDRVVKDTQTELHKAAENGHTETVKLLLDRGVDKGARNNENQTALHLAAENGHTETVKLLLDRGVDKEAKNYSRTALHLAARNGHTETVKLLLDRGVDKEAKNYSGTALHQAARNGHTETVKLLLDRGVDKEAKGYDSETALHLAARSGRTETVKLLLDRGVDKDIRNNDRKTAMDIAKLFARPDLAAMIEAYPNPVRQTNPFSDPSS